MRRYNLLVFLTLMTVAAQAQFINLGATVTIQSGATLRVETNIENNGTGTITNNGTIEVSGNFTNAGTATLTPGAGLVKFIGSANTTLDTGGDALFNVEMAKTSNATVALSAPATIAGNLSFTGAGSKLLLGLNDLTVTSTPADPISATVDHPTNGYVVTNGAGKLIKSISANNIAFVHEIGDATNYTPVSSNVTGTYSSATLAARVYTTGLQTKYAGTSDYIDREWNVVASGITSYTNTMTGTYIDGVDRFGSASLVKGATYYSSDWHFDGSAGAGNTVTASVASPNLDVKLSGMNFFGRVNVKVLLQGAYSDFAGENSSGFMSTTLRTNNLIPLVSPYSDAPVTALSIPANVTDWVKLEARDASNASLILGNTSAFLKNDGSIVGIDGLSLPVIKNSNPLSIISVHHRNHLAIRTPSSLDISKDIPVLHDFRSNLSQAYDSPSVSNDAMKNVVGIGGNAGNNYWVMWGGNGSGNNRSRYSGSTEDLNFILNTPISDPAPFTGLGGNTAGNINNVYSNSDYNMDGRVRYSGSTHDVAFLLNVVLSGLTNGLLTQSL